MTDTHPHNSSARVTLLTMVLALGGLLFGYDTAVISGAVASLDAFFIQPRQLQPFEANSLLGMTVSCALLGCVIGSGLAGWLSHRLGRKPVLIISAALFFVSALGSAVPEMGFQPVGGDEAHLSLTQFFVYRILGGAAVGLASMVVPMYIAEIAPPAIRGRLVAFNQMGVVTGIIVVYFVNYVIALQGGQDWNQSMGWRYMFASETLPALLFFGLLFLVPESPRWLALRERPAEAKSVLAQLHGKKMAEREFEAIDNSIHNHSHKLMSYGLPVLVVGICLSVLQQFVGINVVMYYAPEIFKTMGSGNDSAMLQTIIVGAVNVACTLVAIATVDRFGRKPLMIFGALGMGVAMTSLGLCFYFDSLGLNALMMMLLYVCCFSLSWGPVCWVLLSEIFPNAIRAKALAIAVAAQWISNYLVSWSFPIIDRHESLVALFNHGFAYWIYGGVAFAAALFVWKLVPETKNRSLEEIESLWAPHASDNRGAAPTPERVAQPGNL